MFGPPPAKMPRIEQSYVAPAPTVQAPAPTVQAPAPTVQAPAPTVQAPAPEFEEVSYIDFEGVARNEIPGDYIFLKEHRYEAENRDETKWPRHKTYYLSSTVSPKYEKKYLSSTRRPTGAWATERKYCPSEIMTALDLPINTAIINDTTALLSNILNKFKLSKHIQEFREYVIIKGLRTENPVIIQYFIINNRAFRTEIPISSYKASLWSDLEYHVYKAHFFK